MIDFSYNTAPHTVWLTPWTLVVSESYESAIQVSAGVDPF